MGGGKGHLYDRDRVVALARRRAVAHLVDHARVDRALRAKRQVRATAREAAKCVRISSAKQSMCVAAWGRDVARDPTSSALHHRQDTIYLFHTGCPL